MPIRPKGELLAFLDRNSLSKISCLNISRHMQHYVEESNDALLAKLPVRFRINCVLYKKYPREQLIPFMERFRRVHAPSIQFRFDYTGDHPENLYDEPHDQIPNDRKEAGCIRAWTAAGCGAGSISGTRTWNWCTTRHCHTVPLWKKDPEDGKVYAILYDILIKQNGRIDSDWDGTVMDLMPMPAANSNPTI